VKSLHRTPKSTSAAAMSLALIALLNLNGLANFLFGIGQVFSTVLFIFSAYLIAKNPKLPRSNLAVFLIFMVLFLWFALFFSLTHGSTQDLAKYLRMYLGSILIVWSLSEFVTELPSRRALQRFLKFSRNISIIAVGSVLFSPALYSLYSSVPVSFEFRRSGFFGDPNEAGLMSVFALVLVLWTPFTSKIVNLTVVAVVLVAVVLTFSKTAFITAIIVLMWYIATHFKIFAAISSLLIVMGLQFVDFAEQSEKLSRNQVLDLSLQQAERVLELGLLLSGTINDEVTTGRSTLALLAIERSISNFPFGTGLGSFHHMRDGIMGNSDWLGTHNVFLMVWGEAGFIVFGVLVYFWGRLVLAALQPRAFDIMVPLLVVITMGFMTITGTLGLRFLDFFLAVVIGLSAFEKKFPAGRSLLLEADLRKSAA
jgi:hypothetical protein